MEGKGGSQAKSVAGAEKLGAVSESLGEGHPGQLWGLLCIKVCPREVNI